MSTHSCSECDGTALLGGHCLGHLGREELSIVAARVAGGAPLGARNAQVSHAALNRFLEALRRNQGGKAEVSKVDFGGATFSGFADFSRVAFKGEARFSDATFEAVRFDSAVFRSGARFRDTTFHGKAYFREAQFKGGAYFIGTTFADGVKFERIEVHGPASFSKAEFEGNAQFRKARFKGSAKFRGASFLRTAKLEQARFEGQADFRRASFAEDASYFMTAFGAIALFEHAKFGGDAIFKRAEFETTARFHRASFCGAHFDRCQFHQPAIFDNSEFAKAANFKQARFRDSAGFRSARFRAPTAFGSVIFERDATFGEARFDANVRFADVKFEGETRFDGVLCREGASFRRAAFNSSRDLGLLSAYRVDLDGAVFDDHVRIELETSHLSAVGTIFAAGARLRVDDADVLLEDADFVRQSTLRGVRSQPRLLSLRGAQVAPLALSNVDLRLCRFFGAHGLESLSVEASCLWPSSPDSWRTTQRETIAEEHCWRAEHRHRGKLQRLFRKLRVPTAPVWHDEERLYLRDQPLTPGQIANLYRSLRKAREDAKDAAGAGDLYYGEMEMRRHAEAAALAGGRRRPGEWAVLMGYWIASGYGLRATRALACLLLVLTLGGTLLFWFGFRDPSYDYGRSLIFAAESSLSLLRPPEMPLTPGGEIVQIFLRLLGPLFFGLALLAMRGRVKR